MCAPVAFAAVAAAASLTQSVAARQQAQAQTAANRSAFAQAGQHAQESFASVQGQRHARLMQLSESYGQKLQKLSLQALDASAAMAAKSGASETIGRSKDQLIMAAFHKEGVASAAVARQKQFELHSYYQEAGIDALRARDRRIAAWKPDVQGPHPLTIVLNAASAALSAYSAASAAGIGGTASVPVDPLTAGFNTGPGVNALGSSTFGVPAGTGAVPFNYGLTSGGSFVSIPII